MPFIPDKPKGCQDPEHKPPRNRVFNQAGIWVCPSCGLRTRIIPEYEFKPPKGPWPWDEPPVRWTVTCERIG